MWKDARNARPELKSLIATIGKYLANEGKHAEHGSQDQYAAVAVLNVSRMDHGMQQQAYRIDEDVPLFAFDLLASVISMPVDAEPPFSALLTLWLSITAAVGLVSRPACSRHAR